MPLPTIMYGQPCSPSGAPQWEPIGPLAHSQVLVGGPRSVAHPPQHLSIGTKSCRGPLSPRNGGYQLHEKHDVDTDASDCSRTSEVVERITGWGLVRTHAAVAARVLPRRAAHQPLGAPLIAQVPSFKLRPAHRAERCARGQAYCASES